MGQILRGGREEARAGALQENWESLGRQRVPGKAGASRWKVAEFDPLIQNTYDWGLGSQMFEIDGLETNKRKWCLRYE